MRAWVVLLVFLSGCTSAPADDRVVSDSPGACPAITTYDVIADVAADGVVTNVSLYADAGNRGGPIWTTSLSCVSAQQTVDLRFEEGFWRATASMEHVQEVRVRLEDRVERLAVDFRLDHGILVIDTRESSIRWQGGDLPVKHHDVSPAGALKAFENGTSGEEGSMTFPVNSTWNHGVEIRADFYVDIKIYEPDGDLIATDGGQIFRGHPAKTGTWRMEFTSYRVAQVQVEVSYTPGG